MHKVLSAMVIAVLSCRAYVGPTNIGRFAKVYQNVAELRDFAAFAHIYKNRPIIENVGGLRSVGMFSLWYLLRWCQPDVVIESGVWHGQSTWFIEQTVPNAKLICIDPHLGARQYISQKASYTTKDFSQLDLAYLKGKKVLCFFDDHQNAYQRVLQAYACGFKYLIFDDNYPAPFGTYVPHEQLTLRHCFELPEHTKKALVLKKLIKHYYITPQIFLLPAIVEIDRCRPGANISERSVIDVPAYWRDLGEVDVAYRDLMKIFFDEAATYRWMTYVELY